MSTSDALAQRFVYAAIVICIMNAAALLWMPSLLGALAQGYGLVPRELSYLAFGELGGFLLGTLFTSSMTIRGLQRWVVASCALLITVNVVLLLFAPAVPFVALRPVAGFAAGIGFGYGLKLCTASLRPTRNFGFLTAFMSFGMIIGFQLTAHLVEWFATVGGKTDAAAIRNVSKMIFGVYAALAACAALVLLANRPAEASSSSHPRTLTGRLDWSARTCLVAIMISFVGQGAVWAFLQTLGISHGFTVSDVANAMSVFAVMGIAGSLSAAALPTTVSRGLALSVALVFLWIGLYALYSPPALSWYIAGCAVGGYYWNFALSLMLGLLARVDSTGRGSVLGGTMSSAGGAVGPLLAGLLIQGSNYRSVGWMTAVLCTAGVACVWFVEQQNRRAPTAALA